MKSLPVFPHMRCDDNCGDCCGFANANASEISIIRQYIAENNITPLRQGSTCPLFLGGKCSIYPVRPYICRLFGHSPKLVCSRGHNVNIPMKREEKLMAAYIQEGRPDNILHSLVYSDEEIVELFAKEAVCAS